MNGMEMYENQLRQLLAEIVWNHTLQDKQSDLYRQQYSRFVFIKIGASALTASGIFTVIFLDLNWLKILTAVIALVSLFVNTYCETSDLKGLAGEHKGLAMRFLQLRENIISILTEIKIVQEGDEELKPKIDQVYKDFFYICNKSPDVSEKAASRAASALKKKGDSSYSDDEIDSFLPVHLRKYEMDDPQ